MAEQIQLARSWRNEEEAYSITEQVIRQHSKTFFFATALLPADERRAIRALYAFCRASDDLADCQTTSPEVFQAWREQVRQAPGQQQNPLLAAWSTVREKYGVNQCYEQELLDGIAMDLQFRPYHTWKELELYCYRVASTVGLLAMPIIGLAPCATFEMAAPMAVKLGIALQLTNILRDVGEDALRGRVYLPAEDLDRFQLTTRDIENRVSDSRFTALMRFEIARARDYYHQSLPGIAMLSARARPAVSAAALLYRRILDEIEAIEYQVFHRRAYTTFWKKVSLLPEIFRAAR